MSDCRGDKTTRVVLPDDLLQQVFAFVGKGNFLHVAPVNSTFYSVYGTTFGSKTTSWAELLQFGTTAEYVQRLLWQEKDICKPGRMEQIIKCGRLDVLKMGNLWLHVVLEWPLKQQAMLCSWALHYGQLHLLQWLRDQGCPWDDLMSTYAAKYCQLRTTQAHENGCHWLPTYAAENRQTLPYARRGGSPWHADTCAIAAKNGDINMLTWARALGCPWNSTACENAAAGGHLTLLQWLHEQGCEWGPETSAMAARHGHLEMLIWLHQAGCPLDGKTCASAAAGGHLATLRWAHTNGCPWDRRTTANAALGGHLATLQYAHGHGCRWDARTCANAARGGHLETLQYAHRNGCRWDTRTTANAKRHRHWKLLEWALENGCPRKQARKNQSVLDGVQGDGVQWTPPVTSGWKRWHGLDPNSDRGWTRVFVKRVFYVNVTGEITTSL